MVGVAAGSGWWWLVMDGGGCVVVGVVDVVGVGDGYPRKISVCER